MSKEEIAEFLHKFIPENAVGYMTDFLYRRPLMLKVTRSRASKYGDYRAPFGKHGHRVSVNGDLNPYAFLLTLVHELAHFNVQVEHGSKVKPHGSEWKSEFKKLMNPIMTDAVFPPDVLKQIRIYMINPKASTCSDPVLFTVLNKYNKKPITYLTDIEYGKPFAFRGRVYKRLEKRRTRYKCMQLPENKYVLINGIAEVQKIDF